MLTTCRLRRDVSRLLSAAVHLSSTMSTIMCAFSLGRVLNVRSHSQRRTCTVQRRNILEGMVAERQNDHAGRMSSYVVRRQGSILRWTGFDKAHVSARFG